MSSTTPTSAPIIAGAAAGTIPDYQLSALLMAIVCRGMTTRELVTWTIAMIDSGDRLRWPGAGRRAVDKHSTGGVGDKVSLALAPLAAACGLSVPMVAGRALGHTGGTLDKLEAIPGFRTALTPREMARVLARAGFVLAGQTRAPGARRPHAVRAARRDGDRGVDPADRVVDPVQEGGRGGARAGDGRQGRQRRVPAGARPTRARWRARWWRWARKLGLPVRALLTDMEQPLGTAIGNAAEVREAIDVLRGGGPPDTRALTVRLGAEMLVAGGVARDRARRRPPHRGRHRQRRRAGSLPPGRAACRAATCASSTIRRGCRAPATRGRCARPGAASSGASTPGCWGGRRRCSAPGGCARRIASPPARRSCCTSSWARPSTAATRCARSNTTTTRARRAASPYIEQAFAIGSKRPRPRPLVLESLG